MATGRTRKARTGWESLVAGLSGEGASIPTGKTAVRRIVPMARGQPRRVGRVGSDLELTLHWQLIAEKITGYTMEYRFHPERKWRFDFCWPKEKIAVEVEGGTWSGGRHTTGSGFAKDCEKYNHAAMMGYRVFRFTSDMVKKGEAIKWIREIMNGRHQSE